MLDSNINNLVNLLHSAILTPYNLLENLQLSNYKSINYYKDNDFIVADIVFYAHNEEVMFRYVFSQDNHLQKIYHVDGETVMVQFDRNKEKEETVLKLKKGNQLKKCI